MNTLLLNNGGRPFYNEDLGILQENMLTLENIFGSFSQNQGVVLSGCQIFSINPVENQVSEGLVCIGDKILKLDNAVYNNTIQHFIIADTPQDIDVRTYENGNTQNSTRIHKAIISTTNNNGIALPANPNNQLRNIWQLIQDASKEEIGTIKVISISTFTQNFDYNTGLGSGKWQGWAWADGRNGTEAIGDRMIIGHYQNPFQNSLLGLIGGEKRVTLSKDQTPIVEHQHGAGEYMVETLGAPYLQGTGSTPWRASIKNTNNNKTETSQDNRTIQSHENLPPYIVLPYVQKISYF